MAANRAVTERKETLAGQVVQFRRSWVVMVGFGVAWATASTAYAQCGVGGDWTGQCVNLRLNPLSTSVQVGTQFEVEYLAKSVNGFDQSVQSLDAVLTWDPALIKLIGEQHQCTAGSTADPCFTCPNIVPTAAGRSGYNWVSAGFPNDSNIDGLNADCGPATFCPSYTGLPFNDGNAHFIAFKQLFCGAVQAPPAFAPRSDVGAGSLSITRFTFEALAAGTAQIILAAEAPCATRQKLCLRGDPETLGNPCNIDDECGVRACIGGANDTLPCTSVSQCPGGVCPALCTACHEDNCCTADDNCTECSFSSSRAISGEGSFAVTNTLTSASVTVIDCPTPTLIIDSSRYLNVIPPASAPGRVAIHVQGVSPAVSCVSRYVHPNTGLLLNQATGAYKTPADWQSTMTYAFNDPNDPTVHVRGAELVAGETYEVRLDCNEASPGTSVSDPVQGTLWLSGDTDDNRDRNITDVVRILSGFANVFHTLACTTNADCNVLEPFHICDPGFGKCLWLTREQVDIIGIENCIPDRDISIRDALHSLEGFQGVPNTCVFPCP